MVSVFPVAANVVFIENIILILKVVTYNSTGLRARVTKLNNNHNAIVQF